LVEPSHILCQYQRPLRERWLASGEDQKQVECKEQRAHQSLDGLPFAMATFTSLGFTQSIFPVRRTHDRVAHAHYRFATSHDRPSREGSLTSLTNSGFVAMG